MKISHLALSGVASLPDLDCDFVSGSTGRPHDLIVISGPAASGKTRLTELMLAVLETVAPYQGIVRASDWMADPKRGARVDIDLWLDGDRGDDPGAPSGTTHAVVRFAESGVSREVDRKVARYLSRYDHEPGHGKREYFPENRGRAWGARNDGLGSHEQALMRSSRDPQKYSFVPRFLAELRTQSAASMMWSKTFASHLELLSPTVRYTPAARTGDPTACFTNQSFTNQSFTNQSSTNQSSTNQSSTNQSRSGVLYGLLGSSEADAVLIAATATLIGLHHSIVFLDRPELYVPADRLVAWVEALAKLGEDNQWIVATGDRGLCNTVHRSQLVSLGQGAAAGGASPSQSLEQGNLQAQQPTAQHTSWRPA